MAAKKYTHRIAVAASVMFDLESDNEVPTAKEVDDQIGDMIDGVDFEYDGLENGRVYIAESAVTVDSEINPEAEHRAVTEFSVEDTEENEQEVTANESE